ncbi:hypothetical protein [Streptomyces griseoluteus]|uniref:hypothetical protein n=1 Tax=Streptomyces griseoluteus TaxID=29306 RepID=UPI00332063B4
MAHGTEPSSPNVPQPDGDLVVFAGGYSHRTPAPLSRVPDGTDIIAAGMVMEIREHGTADTPSATFHLQNDFGQATYAYTSAEVLATFGFYLVNGMELSLHGIARRPYPGAMPYIHVLQVEPLTD